MTLTLNHLGWTAILMLACWPAHAHVNLEQREAPRGKSYKAVFKVPHGCKGEATHTVRVEIPEGFIGVKPMPKPGWTIKTERGAYAQEYGYYHGPLKEGVKQIEWSGGELPDDHYDEFVASGFIARELKDAALYFKVVQECANGAERWVEIPGAGGDPHDLNAPAAVLKIADGGNDAAHGHDHHHAHGNGHAHGHNKHGEAASDGAATIGSLAIEGAWTRATAEGAKVGAGYLTIRNTGGDADTLVGVETAVAERGEIHEMSMSEGVMRMRRLADGVEIPAGGSVELKPGGNHLMFMNLKERLVEGERITVTLTFKSGATGSVTLPVRGLGAGKSDKGEQHNHSHH
ncbi:DUF1775 domain-containing protein [Hyphomicrobium sp. CS1GBMeth3]|uniref:DUF1775 domain-containing protein n=1 Tax=Hyphomicrobium sp. CS1GBMeth3 TaxID=1892845 RepID=UPI000930A962|nr:DUF1775 domain-containing protein [Hyphomicrobium sp. CS1GBMeth3]